MRIESIFVTACVICATASLAQPTSTPPIMPTPVVIPAESTTIVEGLPGELTFQATYHHKSRGQDFSVPSMLWVKRSSEETVATSYMPTMNETTAAFVRPGSGVLRYDSFGHGRDGTAPFARTMEFGAGSVSIKHIGGTRDGQVETVNSPVEARFQPNSRPDSYVAHMAMFQQDVPTETFEMDWFDWDNTGKGMASYRTRVEYKGKERVRVPAGTFEAHHYLETQLTFGDTWFKKRPNHITEYWVLDNGIVARILRQREPYELQLETFTSPSPLPGAIELSQSASPVAAAEMPSGHGSITVSVVRSDTGAPIASVDVFARGGINNVVQRAGVAGSDGKLVFDALPQGQYSISSAKPKGYAGAARESALLIADDSTTDVTLKLDAGIRVTGRVTDLEGQPISGATVLARSWNADGGNQFISDQVVCGADGTYEIAGIPRGGRYRIFGKADGFYSGYRTSELNGDAQDFDFALGKGATITGRAVDTDGNPLHDATLSAYPDFTTWRETEDGMTIQWGTQTQLSADGSFTLRDVGTGKYRFHLRAQTKDQNYEQMSIGEMLDVTPGAVLGDVRVVFATAESERIEGTLRDESGAPVPNANVDAITYEGVHWGAKTDANGHYKLVALGEHTFDIYFLHPELPDVKLPKVRPGKLNADAVMPHAGSIVGVVLNDTTGSPLSEGNVEIVWHKAEFGFERGYPEERQGAAIKSDGTFEFPSVLPGQAYLKISAAGYLEKQSPAVTVKANEVSQKVGVRLTPAAIVSGTVLAHGKPLDVEQGIAVMCLDDPIHEVPAGYIIHEGKYSLDRLPAGNYQVTAWARGRGHMADETKMIQVTPGQVMQLDFVLDFPEPRQATTTQ